MTRTVNRIVPVALSLVVVFGLIGLCGCGGGGGGSDTKSSASAAANPYAGTYRGTATITVHFQDQSASENFETVVIVDNNGYTDLSVLADAGGVTCTGSGDEVRLNGPSFSGTYHGTCILEDEISCATTAQVNGNINGTVMSGSYDFIFNCSGVGSVYADVNFTLHKQ